MKKSTTIFVSIIATLLVPYQVHSQKLESIFLSASENRDVPIQKNAFNASFKSFLGISDDYSFKPYDSVAGIKKENEVDALGFNNIRYLQYYKGIKVENADIRVRFRDDKFHSLNGEYVKCTGINTNTILSKTEAIRKAKIFFAGIHDVDSTSLKSYHQTPELVICNNHMRPSDTALYTAFKIDIFSTDKFVHEYIYVDAVSGVILNHLSLIKKE